MVVIGVLVTASMTATEFPALLVTQARPKATAMAVGGSARLMAAVRSMLRGSAARPSGPGHAPPTPSPSPVATATGFSPTWTSLETILVTGSILVRVLETPLTTQTPPSPMAMPVAPLPGSERRRSLPVRSGADTDDDALALARDARARR